jgi:hypothetical protein
MLASALSSASGISFTTAVERLRLLNKHHVREPFKIMEIAKPHLGSMGGDHLDVLGKNIIINNKNLKNLKIPILW